MSTETPPFQSVWLIGGSTGIGRATAILMAARGLDVIVSARSQDRLDQLAEETAALPGRIISWCLDVTQTYAVMKAANEIEAQYGPIDLMLYAAAYWQAGKNSDLSLSSFRSAFDVNLFGAVAAIEGVLPFMKARGRGHIALISSVAGYRGLPRAEAYGASKSAMTYVAEAMRLTLQDYGIKVQVISPGFVETPLTAENDFPMPFIMTADEAAKRIMKGLSQSRFEIAFPKRFTLFLQIIKRLPNWAYFAILRRVTVAKRQ